MADRPDREHAEPRRTHAVDDDLPETEATVARAVPNPPPGAERPSGLLRYIKLQLEIFSMAVILGIVFLVIIILFAVTR